MNEVKPIDQCTSYKRNQDFSFPEAKYRPKISDLDNRRPKRVEDTEENMVRGLRELVNVIFVAGALASAIDGIITAIVVLRVGESIEGNGFMGKAMRLIGVVPLCGLRILVGIGLFWFFRNYTIGRRYFLFKKSAQRYADRIIKTRPKWRQRLWNKRYYWLASELIIGLTLTAAVDGNNIRAYLTLFH